jgi:ribose 5-phosphate isomerase A
MNPKQAAAEAALQFIQSGMVVGLGTGSTAELFVAALGRDLAAGKLRDIRGIPTSRRAEAQAQKLGIPLIGLHEHRPDVTVDGADEVAPNLDVVKGLGGALLYEKVVAQDTHRYVIIVDGSKIVSRLGTRGPIPVEVTPFAHESHAAHLAKLGCRPALRTEPDGRPFLTDNGNYIYHCDWRPDGLPDPVATDRAILARAGVLETGLFLGMVTDVVVADEQGVRTLRRSASPGNGPMVSF